MQGIYTIRNIINNKIYVGQSTNIEKRWEQHKRKFRKNIHIEHFQRSWNKYGEDNFEFTILEECNTAEELNDREKYWINNYKSYDRKYGYNKTFGGDKFMLTEETRDKITQKLIGKKKEKPVSLETRLKLSISTKRVKTGTKHSQQTKNKIANSLRGQRRGPCSEETKKKISLATKGRISPTKGKTLSEETKKKMSKMKKGKKPSENAIIATREKQCKLSTQKAKEILNLINNGLTNVAISKLYNVSASTISRIRTTKIYKNIAL